MNNETPKYNCKKTTLNNNAPLLPFLRFFYRIKNFNPWFIFCSCGLMIMLINIDMTIVNLAIPSIARSLNATLNQTQWVIVGYLLATATCLTLFGKLSDDFGIKRIYLFGIILFTLASLLAGVTHSLHFLIIARFIQGLGFAATLGLSLVIIVHAFPPEKKGYMTGLAVTISGLSQASGPIIGGLILQHFSWQWIFLLNLPFGVAAFTIGLLAIKPDSKKIQFNNLNIINTLSFIFSVLLILYLSNQITVLFHEKNLVALLLAVIFLLLGIFIYSSLKFSKPLIDFSLLRNHTYTKVLLIRFIFMTAMSSLLFLIPLYLENIIGLSPISIGKVLLFMTVMVAISAPLTGRLLDRVGFAYPLLVSLISMALALAIMLSYGTVISWLTLSIGLVLFGIAVGIHTPSSINAALSSVSKEKAGTAIGLFYTIATSGAVIGVALSGGIINIISQHYLLSTMSNVPVQLKLDAVQVAKGVQNANLLDQMPNLKITAQHAFLYAYHIFLSVELCMFLVGVLLCWSLRKRLWR